MSVVSGAGVGCSVDRLTISHNLFLSSAVPGRQQTCCRLSLPTRILDRQVPHPGFIYTLHISPILGRFGGSTAFQVAFFDLPALAALLGRGGHQKWKCPFNLRGFSNSWNDSSLPTLTAMMTTAVRVERGDEEQDHGGSRVQVYISTPPLPAVPSNDFKHPKN